MGLVGKERKLSIVWDELVVGGSIIGEKVGSNKGISDSVFPPVFGAVGTIR